MSSFYVICMVVQVWKSGEGRNLHKDPWELTLHVTIRDKTQMLKLECFDVEVFFRFRHTERLLSLAKEKLPQRTEISS